jgi:hypothetical protein
LGGGFHLGGVGEGCNKHKTEKKQIRNERMQIDPYRVHPSTTGMKKTKEEDDPVHRARRQTEQHRQNRDGDR